MKIDSLPNTMHFDRVKNRVTIEITEPLTLTNSKGTIWLFKPGWPSDGHSTGKYFKHFDAYTPAALCHDQDCEKANQQKSFSARRKGDKDYRHNLTELGAPNSTVLRRYAAVTTRSYWLRLTGKLK